jgi:CubicO group peptidase (beta-lactamase class C family)
MDENTQEQQPDGNPPNIQEVLDAIQKQLHLLATKTHKDMGIPGISLALNLGGRELVANAGTLAIDSETAMDENAHFQMGCISKLLTAMVAAELIEAGKCDPDDPIEKYLEELRGTERGKGLVIWHLLSHTSGYRGLNIADPGAAYYYSWPKFIEFIKTTPQLFKPGSVFSYDHSEYAMMAEIIKRITGKNILDLYREMIFQPLDINVGTVKSNGRGDEACAADHTFNRDTMKFEKLRSIPYGGFWNGSLSGITMNVRDLLRLVSTICGISKAPASMSENALKFVQKQVVKLPRTYGSARHEQIPGSFGVGCAFYRGWLLGHNGSARGQTCGLRFDPRNHIALVVALNAWNPFIRDSIINGIFGMLRGQPVPPAPEEPMESPLESWVGTYVGPQDCSVAVTCEAEQLVGSLHDRGLSTMQIVMQKDEKSILRVVSDSQHYSLGFFRESDSGVDALMLGTLAFRKQ